MGLDTVELILEVEEQFGIEISNDDAEKTITVGDLANLVARLVSQKTGREVDYKEVLPKITNILMEHHGIPREEIHLDAKFVDDLKMD